MIVDWETNKVYFSYSSVYDFKPEMKKLWAILEMNSIAYGHIAGTKDYYCRDYMPVQVTKKKFVQFTFKPDYLLKIPNRRKFATSTDRVLRENKFLHDYHIKNSDIILDGGNVVKSKKHVIVTDKIKVDNPSLERDELKNQLKELLKVEDVFIIPRYPNEETGHADGLLRFIDEKTLLAINLKEEEKEWLKELKKEFEEMKKAGITIVQLPEGKTPDKDWRYINYLHAGKIVIVPKFNNESDKIILPFMYNLFLQRGIEMFTVKASAIAKYGGVLNCFSWNILSK